MEQRNLEFSAPEGVLSPEEVLRKELGALPYDELKARYLAAVRVNPRVGTDLNTIIEGVVNPQKERARLYEIESAEDREAREKMHLPN